MKCPFCGSEDTQVVDTRANLEANTIRRRRKCVRCEKRFTTYERVDLKMPRLVKKDGSRTDFDRDKLMGSMMLRLRWRSPKRVCIRQRRTRGWAVSFAKAKRSSRKAGTKKPARRMRK